MMIRLLCFIASLPVLLAVVEVDDIVSEAAFKAYQEVKNEHYSCSGDENPATDPGEMFIFLQKQKSNEDPIARAGHRYIRVLEFLTKMTGKPIQELIDDKAFQISFSRQLCERVTPACVNEIHAKYRHPTGLCNNIKNPTWGAALQAHARYLAPVYEDGITKPHRNGSGDEELPNPRIISNTVFAGNELTPEDNRLTLMFFAMGQFLDHDMTFTPIVVGKNGNPLDCCGKDRNEKECFPIDISENDPHFQGRLTCMDFSRSLPVPFRDGCEIGYREQLNRLTSFIDGGMIYGDSKRAHEILDAKLGQLRTSEGELLPEGGICMLSDDQDHCQLAGDERVNEFPALGGMHIVFLRFHNILAKRIRKLTGLNSQRVFLETRKIMGAIMQQITYGEFLPILLGPRTRNRYSLNLQSSGYWNKYNENINPAVKNVVAAAALRYGHSQIPPEIGYLGPLSTIASETFKTEDVLLDPHLVVTLNGKNLPDLMRFVTSTPARRIDRQIENAARNELFGGNFDLIALNIQRGRDHGLQPYNKWREWCGLHVATSFTDLRDHNPDTRRRLQQAYNHVDDIDVFVGGMTEIPRRGARVGRLFDCILGRQFRDLKHGDRFWYENSGPGGFTLDQLDSIRQLSFAKIMCEALELKRIQRNVFILPGPDNPLVMCDSLPTINLAFWFHEAKKYKK